MIVRLLYCLFLLAPLVSVPAVLIVIVSTGLGIAAAVVAAILGVPLLLATSAHADLVQARRRYGLRRDELSEFIRLVPQLACQAGERGLSGRARSRLAKEAAAETVLSRRQS